MLYVDEEEVHERWKVRRWDFVVQEISGIRSELTQAMNEAVARRSLVYPNHARNPGGWPVRMGK